MEREFLSMTEAISIEGTLMALDNTPYGAVPVQALRINEWTNERMDESTHLPIGPFVIATTLSDEAGRYRFINLKPGLYQVRCQVLGGYVYYISGTPSFERDGELPHLRGEVLHVEHGNPLSNIDFRFAPFKKGTWRNYSYFNGLANNYVNAIHCASDGALWFGTYGGGVSRCDGKELVNFTTADGLAHNDVWAIYCDADGTMWLGTEGGLSRYDGRDFVTFTSKDGLAHNFVHAIHRDPDGVMWFGTEGGVSRYDGTRFVNFTQEDGLAHNRVWAVHCSPDGVLWFGTYGGGVSRYDGKGFVNFTQKDGLASNCVHAIHRDPAGVMWFGTNEGGFSRYDGKRFVNFTQKDGLANNRVHAIHRDPAGVMWFGTNGGASRYDGKGFVNFTTKDGLAHSQVHAIYRAPDRAIWFGTWGGGVSRYDENALVNFTRKDGLASNKVHEGAVYCDPEGSIWFGMNNGVSRYDGKRFVTQGPPNGLAGHEVWAIHRGPDGALWFGTENGLFRYDGKEFVTFTTTDGLPNNRVTAIHRGPDEAMWFGTEDGLSRVVYPFDKLRAGSERSRRDGKEFVNFTTTDGLAGNFIWAIHRGADGAMWFGTHDNGVSRYDGKGSRRNRDSKSLAKRDPDLSGQFVNFTTKDGLASNRVRTIYCAPDGALWFGTYDGVSRYDGEIPPLSPLFKGGKGGFVNFTTKDGLASHIVYAIHRTSDGVMWFGTEGGGVSGYDGIAWTSLDTRDGLAGNIVSAIYQDSDGGLWFGTCDGGITRYRRDTTPPHALIVAVTTDRRYTNLNDLCPVTAGTRVTFAYGSIDFKTHPDKRLYRYRMRETRRNVSLHDADWSKPTRKTEVDYGDLPAGEYIFQVQAIDRDLNYSEPATVRVTVQLDARDIKLAALNTEVDYLRREAGRKYQFENIIGRSAAIKQMQALMEKAIDSGLTVLITGETGTGKELVAKAIHFNSPRKDHPLLDRNCGALPKDLVTSTLFGHRRGTFTGAYESTPGLFEAASGGTVLLDEIGEMSQDAQVHLLRVLQERKVQRLGENQLRDVDVRVIAITNRDLAEAVKAGDFRKDLYYRLRVFPIHLPALRERLEDIPVLADHLLQKACADLNKPVDGFAPGVIEMLQSYPWPGNIRELENEIYRAVALVEEGLKLQTYHFSPEVTQGESLIQEMMPTVQPKQSPYREIVDRFERRYIDNALQACNGNRTQAAKMLGIDRKSLYERMQRLHIDIPPDIPRKPTNK